jgi:hypothetical protein
MTTINPVQGNPSLAALLAAQSSSGLGSLQAISSTSTSPADQDSLSLSAAALQALAGQGMDPSQLLPGAGSAATYSARGHHHHHHGARSAAAAVPTAEAPSQATVTAATGSKPTG